MSFQLDMWLYSVGQCQLDHSVMCIPSATIDGLCTSRQCAVAAGVERLACILCVRPICFGAQKFTFTIAFSREIQIVQCLLLLNPSKQFFL